jgi:hypothetical protein
MAPRRFRPLKVVDMLKVASGDEVTVLMHGHDRLKLRTPEQTSYA